MSPTARSLERLREQGYLPAVVEHWNNHARVRQDLYGFIDVLAVRPGETLAVQACRAADISTRLKKVRDHQEPEPGSRRRCPHCCAQVVLAAGWRIVFHGWRQDAEGRWVLREEWIS